uniref:Uncharacterized protein n=1 Tax=Ciona savignyi TaxID=51511 RepID=H2YAD6_CIOSA
MMVFTMAKAVVLPDVGPVGVLGGDFLSNNIKVFFNGTNCNSDVQCEIVDFYGNVVTSDAGENVANIFTKYPVLAMKLTTAGVATSEWCSNIWTSSNKQNPRLNITMLGNGMTLGSYYVQRINGTNLILVQIHGEVAEETCVVHAIPELMCSPTTTCQSSCTQYSPTCMTSMNTSTHHHGCYQTSINNYKLPLLTSDNHKHPVCYEKFANWNDFVDDDDIDDKDIFSFIRIIGPVMQYGGQAVFAVGVVAWVVYRMKKRSSAQTSPNQFNPDGTIPPPPPPLGDQGNYPGMPPPPPPMGNYPGMPPLSPMGDQGNYPNMPPPPMANQGNYYPPPLQQNYGFQQNFAQQPNMGQPEWQTQYSTPLQPQPPQYPPPPY